MAVKPRYFTVEQANDIVKAIRPLVREILRIRQEILDKQPDVWPVISKAISNGGSKVASQITQEFDRLETLTREINATGATLKDINSGLVDFLAIRQGHEVYLCWQYGEERIEFWHELDGGFAGRQRLV
jgi:hypothetical protein